MKWLNKFLSSKPEPVLDEKFKPTMFSTDLPDTRPKAADIAAAISRSIQVTKLNVAPTANGITMDSACLSTDRIITEREWGLPSAQLMWYASQGFIGHNACAILSQNWLISKACSMPARDAVRHGFNISVKKGVEVPQEALDDLKDLDDDFKLTKHMVEYVRVGRIFGVRIALFLVDGIDYEKPFNIDGVKPGSYRGISQIDPYWAMPEMDSVAVSNPMAEDFYEPTWWSVQGKRIHKSHLVIFRGDEVPDILKPTYLFGGIPVPQKVAERVYAAERTANEAPMLAMTKRTTTLATDLAQAIANEKNFSAKIEKWASIRDNYGVKVIGENENITQLDTSLTDLDQVIMTQYQIVAAASNVPATKLLGTTPKGFNSTGDYEEDSYHEELETIQAHDLTPMILRHKELCIKSVIAPKYGIEPFSVEITWNPVDTLDDIEQAQVNLTKAQTGEALVNSGAIDSMEERERLINDKDSGYSNLTREPPIGDDPLGLNSVIEGGMVLDAADFDANSGMFDGAILITNQEYLDESKVKEKSEKMDYDVQVSPVFKYDGKDYRIIIDGHHSLAAAIQDGVQPVFMEFEYGGSDYKNAITKGFAFDSIEVK